MAIFKKSIDMPALFRALADLAESCSTYEESFQVCETVDLLGDDREKSPRLTIACNFRHDLDTMTLDLGALYQEYGGNPLDFLSREVVERLNAVQEDDTDFKSRTQIDKDVLDPGKWDIAVGRVEMERLPFERKIIYYARAEIQRKDQKVFESVVGKRIMLSGALYTITESRMKHFLASSGQVSASAFITCELRVDDI